MRPKEIDTIRAFVAVELEEGVKKHITSAIETLQQEQIEGLRLVRPEGVHLTLKFLGNIGASQISQVAGAIASVASRHSAFDLILGSAGVFPNPRRARVLWIGVDGDIRRLTRLQTDMDDALTAVGFQPESRQFNPHLTIGRMHHRASRANRHRAAGVLAAVSLPDHSTIAVNTISLMKSTLLPNGAVYERIAHSSLTHKAS